MRQPVAIRLIAGIDPVLDGLLFSVQFVESSIGLHFTSIRSLLNRQWRLRAM